MGRKKGESYRKGKLREVKRVNCPRWTINEALLGEIANTATAMGICQSRIVEAAISKMLKNPTQIMNKTLKIERIFTKS